MKIRNCCIAVILVTSVVCGCRKTESDSSHSTQKMISQPDQIAQYLCKYSRGSYPNWILYRDYDNYLTENEAQSVRFIAQKLRESIAPSGRPKQLAIARFLANHTECIPLPEENIIDDETNAVVYTFEQHTPIIPNVPEVVTNDIQSEENIAKLYINDFEKSWDGNHRTRKIQIILEKTENDRYVIRTQIANTYAKQLREDLFWRSMEDKRYDKAIENLKEICENDEELCDSLSPFLESAQRSHDDIRRRFESETEIGTIQFKLVSLGKNQSYSVASFTLTNRGSNTYKNIIFTTNEVQPQRCELQASQNNRHDDPLTLYPNQTVQTWCALNSNTLPTTQLTYYSSK